ncbi:unnamed protein product, partial [Clonostachys rosea f. rosea IK726]
MNARTGFIEVNQRIEKERRRTFLGTASISIQALSPRMIKNPAKESRVLPLRRIFEEEQGYRKEDTKHHIKAAVSSNIFEQALEIAQIPARRLLEDHLPYVELDIPSGEKLECLQGSDRILAAGEAFNGSDQRWIVDLFLDGRWRIMCFVMLSILDMSKDLKTLFVEEYEYQKVPTDGEFYCKIREHQGFYGQKRPFFERLWLGRLSATWHNRKKNLDSLSKHKKLRSAFDALLVIPASFCGFRLTVIHEVIAMKCDEPNINYLEYILFVWEEICNGDREAMGLVDRHTVELLQGTAPGAFKIDHDELQAHIKAGYIFSNFSQDERDQIWPRICRLSRQRLIPSLFTFFEDRKLLTAAANCIRHLEGIDSDMSSHLKTMYRKDSRENMCPIQVAENTYINLVFEAATKFDISSRQLWLAAFREFKALPAKARKKDLVAKSRAE